MGIKALVEKLVSVWKGAAIAEMPSNKVGLEKDNSSISYELGEQAGHIYSEQLASGCMGEILTGDGFELVWAETEYVRKLRGDIHRLIYDDTFDLKSFKKGYEETSPDGPYKIFNLDDDIFDIADAKLRQMTREGRLEPAHGGGFNVHYRR